MSHPVSDKNIITILKVVMTTGLCLIGLGVYFHMFSEWAEELGVTGIILSACLVAIGMIMSLPTKMYLTFVLVKLEHEKEAELREQQRQGPPQQAN